MPKSDVGFPLPVSSRGLFIVQWTLVKAVWHRWEDLVFLKAWCWEVALSNKGKLFLELPLWEPVLLFSMVLLLEVIERRQLDFPSSHSCAWVCAHTLPLFDISLVVRVNVCVCLWSAVIQAYLRPRGLAADCSLKVTTHDLCGLGCRSVSWGAIVSLQRASHHTHTQTHTRQRPIHTCSGGTGPLGKESAHTS